MNQVLRSLEEVTTVYTVFEKDQVLTHEQLNSLVQYLDDQHRLARVRLVGVGIGCGLRPSVIDGGVKVTKGVGITTDGDLMSLAADTLYDRFKVYEESAPRYAPFYTGDARLTAWELVPQGVADAAAVTLDGFSAQTEAPLTEMVAVLLMESYVKDEDVCSGSDCDNLGKDAMNTMRLLLVDGAAASRLREDLLTPGRAAAALEDIVIARPIIPAGVGTLGAFAGPYRTAAESVLAGLRIQLAKIYPACGPLFGDELPADPAPQWFQRLEAIKASFAGRDAGVQYYYDFLKDLAETFNDFRRLMSGDSTVGCPRVDAFPKHLVLGGLGRSGGGATGRTGFYPSPVVSATVERWDRARFLVSKIGAAIQAFNLPGAGAAVRVTPSTSEDRCLEERAIPYYYRVGDVAPIHQAWNYDLARRGMGASNYSYNAADYGAQGAAANPLGASIGRFPFFRIEGHLGGVVDTVTAALTAQVRDNHLPFTVRAVLLGQDRTKIVVKPPIRYSDLHRVHYLLRQEAATELDDTVKFSGALRDEVTRNVGGVLSTNEADLGDAMKKAATERHTAVAEAATNALGKLQQSYSLFRADPSWTTDVRNAAASAGSFRSDIAGAVRTEFTTPFDTLTGGRAATSVDLLGRIIESKTAKEDDRLLFSNFARQHPGFDHLGGVPRGGTFVLVYDSGGTVVGDVALDEYWPETEEQEDEPPLKPVDFKPSQLGVRLTSTIDKTVTNKLTGFRAEIEPQLTQQKDYLQLFRDSVTVLGGAISGKGLAPGTGILTSGDKVLETRVVEAAAASSKVEALRGILAETPDPGVRAAVEQSIQSSEQDLVAKIDQAVVHLGSAPRDTSAGSEAAKAVDALVKSAANVTSSAASAQLVTRVNAASATTTADLQAMMGRLLIGRG